MREISIQISIKIPDDVTPVIEVKSDEEAVRATSDLFDVTEAASKEKETAKELRTCLFCGTEFTPNSSTQKYCRPAHKDAYYRKQKKHLLLRNNEPKAIPVPATPKPKSLRIVAPDHNTSTDPFYREQLLKSNDTNENIIKKYGVTRLK